MPRTRRPVTDGLQFRSFGVEPTSTNDTDRSLEIIATTEEPTMMPDWDRMEMIPEVLLMSGVKLPTNRTVPLLNSHQRGDALDVIGSAKNLRVENGILAGKAVLSSAVEGIWTRMKEGHLRDLSVGYRIEKKRFIPEGTTEKIAGRDYAGPVNVVTSWKLREVSVTPIGADEQAKVRGLTENPFATGEKPMLSQELRDKLVARGMPEDTEDSAAVTWAVENPQIKEVERKEPPAEEKPGAKPTQDKEREKSELAQREEIRKAISDAVFTAGVETRKIFDEELRATRKLHDYARAQCKHYGLDSAAQDLIDTCREEKDIDSHLLVLLHKKQLESPRTDGFLAFGTDAGDKLTEAMRTSICLRALRSVQNQDIVNAVLPKDKRAPGYEDCVNWTPMRYAKMCVKQAGINIDRYSDEQIARFVIGDSQALGLRDGGVAYHQTGSFAKLTQDAFDVSLRAGYMEYPSTWQEVFRTGEPFQNFNAKHLVQFGEFPNLDQWDGVKPPNEISVADAEEFWRPEAYHNVISYGWKLLIGDNMDALSRTPIMYGNAAARTLNTHVWSIVTANALMQDGVALFSAASGNRKKDNLTGSGTAISVDSLGVGYSIMTQQVGLNTPENAASQAILGIRPKYLVVPSSKYLLAMQTVKSATDPAASNNAKFNPWTYLTPIIEPLLDANSTTAWYLIAGANSIDTIQVSFLNGYETPQTRQWKDDRTQALFFGVLQAYAAKAIDWRGFYKNVGA